MTTRDRTVLLVLLTAGLLAGFWFMVLGPKRDEAKKLHDQVASAQHDLDKARASVATAQQAKARYAADYATVARLGKAVPVDDNTPSLIYELGTAADKGHIDFQSIKVNSSGAPASVQTTQSQAIAVANGSSSSSSSSSSTSSSGSTSSSSTPAPATQVAAAALPPGATVGTAGLPTMPFSFVFQGSFFDMQHFLANVNRFIELQGKNVRVTGRLLSIDGLSLSAGPNGFPQIKADLTATAYMLPADEGLTNGATPTSPAAVPASSTTSSSGTSTPTATATGVHP